MSKFIQLINNSYNEIEKVNHLLTFLESFKTISSKNIIILNHFKNALDSLNSTLKFISLKNKLKSLKRELTFSEIKYKSSKISANRNLIKKLKQSIAKNKKELDSIKQDYFNIRNQRNEILKAINNYQGKVDELNQEKKLKFNEINEIIRTTETPPLNNKKEFLLGLDLSNDEKMKKLKQEAKSINNDIKDFKSKIADKKGKLSDIEPKFQIYEQQYTSSKNTIEKNETQINEIQAEMENLIQPKEEIEFNNSNVKEFDMIRSPEILEDEIDKIKMQLEKEKKSNQLLNKNIISCLNSIDKNLSQILSQINENEGNLTFSIEQEILSSTIKQFRRFESLLTKIEQIMNYLLREINLNLDLKIAITEESNEFFLHPIFSRNKEQNLKFDELTTPEKIFYVVVFYIALMIILNNTLILFSNLFLHQDYNKRGSLFRTLKKMIPAIKSNSKLKDFKFIFVISNLEMKKKIDNINIITFEKGL